MQGTISEGETGRQKWKAKESRQTRMKMFICITSGGAGGKEFWAQGYGHRCVTTFRFLIELIRHQWRGEKKKSLTGP